MRKKKLKNINISTDDDVDVMREKLIDDFKEFPTALVFQISEAARIAHQAAVKDKNVKRLRDKSGEVTDKRLLVAFLYVLMRDVVPPGVMEGTLLKLSNSNVEDEQESYTLTNGYLAKYAQDIADRLEQNRLTGDKEQTVYANPFRR